MFNPKPSSIAPWQWWTRSVDGKMKKGGKVQRSRRACGSTPKGYWQVSKHPLQKWRNTWSKFWCPSCYVRAGSLQKLSTTTSGYPRAQKTRYKNERAPRICEHGDYVRDSETIWWGANTGVLHVGSCGWGFVQNTNRSWDMNKEMEGWEMGRGPELLHFDNDEWWMTGTMEATASVNSETMHPVSFSSSCSSPKREDCRKWKKTKQETWLKRCNATSTKPVIKAVKRNGSWTVFYGNTSMLW